MIFQPNCGFLQSYIFYLCIYLSEKHQTALEFPQNHHFKEKFKMETQKK